MALERSISLEPQEPTGNQTSLALRHALPGSGSVLDLGPAQGGNVTFFASRGCKLFIADLRGSVFSTPPPSVRKEALLLALDRDLPGDECFDLILVWDLLNYLSDIEIKLLSERLQTISRENTMLFALISIRKEIPDRPGQYQIVDSERIHYVMGSQFQRPSPQHKEPGLARLLPGFKVSSTYLLRNGMQEYLFRCPSTRS